MYGQKKTLRLPHPNVTNASKKTDSVKAFNHLYHRTAVMILQLIFYSSVFHPRLSCFFQGPNVARGGIATQSSLWNRHTKAQNAIDGNRADTTITHTKHDYRPWWRVDLRADYKVTYITVTNRKDCCTNRLNGAEIRIGDSLSDNGNRNKRLIISTSISIRAFNGHPYPERLTSMTSEQS